MSNKQRSCSFCRETLPKDDEEIDRRKMKRVEAGDAAAMVEVGVDRRCEGDYDTALQYFTDAAKLGDVEAHYHLGVMYEKGEGVEEDEEKEVYHYEMSAIGGDPSARFNLGNHEERSGRDDRAVKHWIISAKLGHIRSMEALWEHYKLGNITKQDLEATLRTHQAALDAMKSPQREAAQAAFGG
jgi:TPR repeat protein